MIVPYLFLQTLDSLFEHGCDVREMCWIYIIIKFADQENYKNINLSFKII